MKFIHVLGLAALALPLAATASAQSRGSDQDYIREPVRLDKTIHQTLQNGCKYTLNVNGTILPDRRQSQNDVPIVTPHVAVAAQTVCPNAEAVKVTNNILGSGPLTWKQLEDSISQRSRVRTVENNHQCTYGASMKIVDRRLQLDRFDHHCTAL